MVTRRRRLTGIALVVGSALLIGLLTLRPTNGQSVTPALCIFCGSLGGVDFALNVVLFVPLGIGLQWLTGRWRTAIIVGFLATVTVEALQWRLVVGRDASLGDVLANTIGTGLGAWIAIQLPFWLRASHILARRLAWAFATLACAVFISSAWLLQPVRPDGFQWVQFTPIRINTELFRGRLVRVALNDSTIRPATTLRPQQTFDQTSRQSLRVVVDGHVRPSTRQAIIVRAANDQEEAFFLAQRGQSVVYRSYITACEFKLRPILVRHETAFALAPEMRSARDEVVIDAWSRASEIGIRVPGTDDVRLPRTVGLAWALFLPSDFSLDTDLLLVNALWLFALVLPTSFFIMRTGVRAPDRRLAYSRWGPLAVILGVLAATPFSGLHQLSLAEWGGLLASLVAGTILERLTKPLTTVANSFPATQDRIA